MGPGRRASKWATPSYTPSQPGPRSANPSTESFAWSRTRCSAADHVYDCTFCSCRACGFCYASNPHAKAQRKLPIDPELCAGGGTVEGIAAKVAKHFPDRKLAAVTGTVRVQVTRLARSPEQGGRGLKVRREETDKGEFVYSI